MATPKIDAYFKALPISPNRPPLESIAQAIGNDPKLCEERLRDALTFYMPTWQQRFKGAAFVPSLRQLQTPDGCYVLEYRVRRNPDMPESYKNQQTSMGVVLLLQVLEELNGHR